MERDARPSPTSRYKERTDESFDAFVGNARASLVRMAFTVSGSWEEAEDLVQVALCSVYLHWASLDHARSEVSYAMRTVVNRYIDDHRHVRWTRETLCADLPETSSLPDDHAMERHDVLAALTLMPERMRLVLLAQFFLDMTVEETAAMLHCTSSTVRSQTTRALRKARVSPVWMAL